ncbi:uncharacterized protein LOC127833977 [Dreissena polymorpha]|uniref:non-specific serine/threonine protein kinase n=1 Tax=Dreissena polymorpha TaxID=45954 RepID=A0A9D4JHM8_DREPO|nr:uncharacterized protein LOC127833977 [Dreissena polymorpha]KAH3812285.1 hypothetical protein DPMN_140711 [Dreissena polymorpha]
MTGGKNGTRTSGETFLRHLPYSVLRRLSLMLDIDKQWEKLVTLIPKNIGDVGSVDLSSASSEKRYSHLQIRIFEEKGKRPEGSPTKAIIDDWATQNTMVKHLVRVLQEAHLGEAANYLHENVLNMGPLRDLSAPSSACNSLSDLPEPRWIPNRSGDIHVPSSNVNEKSEKEHLCDKQIEYEGLSKGSVDNDYYKLRSGSEGLLIGFYESGGKSMDLEEGVGDAVYSMQKDLSVGEKDIYSIAKLPEAKQQMHGAKEPIESDDRVELQQKRTEAQKLSAKTDIYKLIGPHREMSYQVLQHITLDFKQGEVANGGRSIGSGGFGEVFLGVFDNGHKVAIKKLKKLDEKEEMMKQFKTELESLTKYRHPNIVCLYAYSIDGPVQCLVYEYLPNGSLEDRLQRKNQTVSLCIKTRLQILQGTAKGIAFLNTQGIVHRDIKSANVLLDDDYSPKVGDFATARAGPMGNQTKPMSTSVVIGTSAYLAPEAIHFDVSTKLDAFSYGIIVLEVLTALPPMDDTREERDLKSHMDEHEQDISSLLDWTAGQWSDKLVTNLMDISVRCTARKKQRVNVADILLELESLDAFL